MYWRAPVCTTNAPDSAGQSIAVRYKTRRKSAAAALGKCHIFAARVPYQRLRRSAAEPESVQSAQDVRLEPDRARVAKFGGRPPPDLGEFARVRTQGCPTRPARANHRLTSTCRVAGGPTVSVIVRKKCDRRRIRPRRIRPPGGNCRPRQNGTAGRDDLRRPGADPSRRRRDPRRRSR